MLEMMGKNNLSRPVSVIVFPGGRGGEGCQCAAGVRGDDEKSLGFA